MLFFTKEKLADFTEIFDDIIKESSELEIKNLIALNDEIKKIQAFIDLFDLTTTSNLLYQTIVELGNLIVKYDNFVRKNNVNIWLAFQRYEMITTDIQQYEENEQSSIPRAGGGLSIK